MPEERLAKQMYQSNTRGVLIISRPPVIGEIKIKWYSWEHIDLVHWSQWQDGITVRTLQVRV